MTPVYTGRDGKKHRRTMFLPTLPWTRVIVYIARVHGPCQRAVLTGNVDRRP